MMDNLSSFVETVKAKEALGVAKANDILNIVKASELLKKEDSIKILHGLKDKYEKHHHLTNKRHYLSIVSVLEQPLAVVVQPMRKEQATTTAIAKGHIF